MLVSGVAERPKLQAPLALLTKKVDESTSIPPVILVLPTTSSFSVGVLVQIPTLPPASMFILPTPLVISDKAKALVFPKSLSPAAASPLLL